MTVHIPASLGMKLKLLRKKNALTGKEVCEKLGINRTSLYKWENDLTVPQAHNIRKLAELYNVKVTELTKEA